MSSAYNARSNGQAEAAIRAMKLLLANNFLLSGDIDTDLHVLSSNFGIQLTPRMEYSQQKYYLEEKFVTPFQSNLDHRIPTMVTFALSREPYGGKGKPLFAPDSQNKWMLWKLNLKP